MGLPRPGAVGITIRLVLAALVLWFFGIQTILDTPSFFDGYTDPLGSVIPVAALTYFSRSVVNELVQRRWGWWPSIMLLVGLGITITVGYVQDDPFGPMYGIYVWAWSLMFGFLLGPAFLLAAILRTPGCEMRSYAHLVALAQGKDSDSVACPGWVDRFDHVRIGGK